MECNNESSRKIGRIKENNAKLDCNLPGKCESRWKENGEQRTVGGNLIVYFGNKDRHKRGVALIVKGRWSEAFLEWIQVSDRILYARYTSRSIKMSVVVINASRGLGQFLPF